MSPHRLPKQSLGAIVLAAFTSPAGGAGAEDFYRGKTVNFIVGYPVGGGYDTYSRLSPAISVSTLPGILPLSHSTCRAR